VNDETFGKEAAHEMVDDAVNDETFGEQAAFETADGLDPLGAFKWP
jgi:hypothetical protein